MSNALSSSPLTHGFAKQQANPSSMVMHVHEFIQHAQVKHNDEVSVPGHCFIIVRKQALSITVNNDVVSCPPFCLLHVTPGSSIQFHCSIAEDATVLIIPDACLVMSKYRSLMMDDFQIFTVNQRVTPIPLTPIELADVTMLLNRMSNEVHCCEPQPDVEYIHNTFISLLFLFEKICRGQNMHVKEVSYDEQLLQQFAVELEKNYVFHRDVEYYATRLHITARKLNQVVSVKYGKNVKKVIEQRVLHGMKQMLSKSTNSLKETGYHFGFSDPTNFNKFFKKHTAVTPAVYRAQNKQQVSTIQLHEITIERHGY